MNEKQTTTIDISQLELVAGYSGCIGCVLIEIPRTECTELTNGVCLKVMNTIFKIKK